MLVCDLSAAHLQNSRLANTTVPDTEKNGKLRGTFSHPPVALPFWMHLLVLCSNNLPVGLPIFDHNSALVLAPETTQYGPNQLPTCQKHAHLQQTKTQHHIQ